MAQTGGMLWCLMGRHSDASDLSVDARRITRVSALVGGACWVVAYVLPGDGSLHTGVLWAGAALLTIGLAGLGLMLVRSDVPALRLFVAVALPALVWGVFGVVHGSTGSRGLVDALSGAVAAVVAAVGLRAHAHAVRRETL